MTHLTIKSYTNGGNDLDLEEEEGAVAMEVGGVGEEESKWLGQPPTLEFILGICRPVISRWHQATRWPPG
jgi:hypothetical protein